MTTDDKNPKYDTVRSATGVVGTRDAATAAGYASMLPGAFGNVAEGVGTALNIEAEDDELLQSADDLAKRVGRNTGQFKGQSSIIRSDRRDYQDGTKHATEYTGLGVKIAGAAAGAALGAVMFSFIPFIGTLVGGLIGGAIGALFATTVAGMVLPEKKVSSTQVVCEACQRQDEGTIEPVDIMKVVSCKASPSERKIMEKAMANKNQNGFGLDHIAERHLAPLLGDDFYNNRDETACEYVARLCRERRVDVAQLALDVAYMTPTPPRGARGPQVATAGFDDGRAGVAVPQGIPMKRADVVQAKS